MRFLSSNFTLALNDVSIRNIERMVYCIFFEFLGIDFFVLLLIFNLITQNVIVIVFSFSSLFFIIILHFTTFKLIFLSNTVRL